MICHGLVNGGHNVWRKRLLAYHLAKDPQNLVFEEPKVARHAVGPVGRSARRGAGRFRRFRLPSRTAPGFRRAVAIF